jgi:hypothetical protein
LGPIYISDNVDDGKKDYEAFFHENEEDKEEILPHKPVKTSKLEVTIPQYKGEEGDEIPEHTCEKGEMSLSKNNEVSGSSSAFGQTPSLEGYGQEAPAHKTVNPEV